MYFIYALVAAIVFGFFDYVGYNTLAPKNLILYRIIQTLFQLGLAFILYFISDIWVSLGFMLLWWVWVCDLIYYFFYDTLKWYGGEYAGKAFKTEVLGNLVTWAWWTPYGLVTRLFVGKKDEPIPGKTLLIQAAIGFLIVLISLSFNG